MILDLYTKETYRGRLSKKIGWIYGYSFKTDKNDNIVLNFKNNVKIFVVEKDTIQQCTGNYDKNNIPIFEGDLCKSSISEEENSILLCKYFKEVSAFVLMTFKDTLTDWSNEDIENFPCLIVASQQQHYEVCGNIIDNPELFYNS